MAAKIIEVTEALREALETALEKEVFRKYVNIVSDKNIELKDERIMVLPIGEETTIRTRGFDTSTYQIGIEVAQLLPESGQQTVINPDAQYNQLEFLDAKMAVVEEIKDLFRGGGSMREEKFAGCVFTGLEQLSPFDAENLRKSGVFVSRVIVSFEADSSDDL